MPQKKGLERKRGNRLGFRIFGAALRLFGLTGAYGLLYIVGLYYLAFDSAVVRAGRAYAKRRFPKHGAVRLLVDVYLLFVNQGKSLVDRYYIMAGGRDIEIEINGYEKVKQLLSGDRGIILLTAHVGNWQVAMTALRRMGKKVYLMMRPEDNAAVKESLNIDTEQESVRILSTNDALGGVIEAMKAIEQGDIVSIMGDRTYEYSSLEADLFGSPVAFPYGAFSIAAAARCPVVVLLSAKAGTKKYITDVTHVIEPPAGPREKKQEQIKACVQQFARVLEDYSARYPYQWFVFRDIWASNR